MISQDKENIPSFKTKGFPVNSTSHHKAAPCNRHLETIQYAKGQTVSKACGSADSRKVRETCLKLVH